MNFLSALIEHEFLRIVLVAGLLSGLGCGIVGSLVVVRRITFLAGGIAHAVLGGLGLAHYFEFPPLLGAGLAACLAALLIGWISQCAKQREDMLIGALWAVGMAVGIIAIAHTPGYNTDLMSYLLGNLLTVTSTQVIAMVVLDTVIIVVIYSFWQPLELTTFDEEYARARGLPTLGINLVILVMVALSVVLMVQTVGLVLVMALLTMPAAAALLFTTSLGRTMLITSLIATSEIVFGLGLAFETDSPAGATIVLVAACVYLLALAARSLLRERSA